MSISSVHPLYSGRKVDWVQMRDTYAGERQVKQKGFVYLPATSGMIQDGAGNNTNSPGFEAYDTYRKRACFPGKVGEAVEALIGAMHRKPAVFELPSSMDYLTDKATLYGESLQMLLRRINVEQLVTGRVGLLGDVFERGDRAGEVYFAVYHAESVINWDDGNRDSVEPQRLNLVVLNESEAERTSAFEWEEVEKYRVLILGDVLDNEQSGGTYRVGVFREDANFNEDQLIEPTIKGRTSGEIPFEFINSKDIVSTPDDPPLLGLSDLCLTVYRGEADYRQALFMQGQDTLVTVGMDDDKPIRVGAGASINLPMNGSAQFIGVDSKGLPEMREAQQNDLNRADEMSGKLLDTVSRERESGDALRIRVAARTATLNQLAMAGAFGLQSCLRKVAAWIGANPEDVIVRPNLDFSDDSMTGKSLAELMGAKMIGAPLAIQTIHKLMEQRGITDLTFDEELAQIQLEVDTGVHGAEVRVPGDEEEDDEDDADDESEDDEDEEN